jgi:hypothetical protein
VARALAAIAVAYLRKSAQPTRHQLALLEAHVARESPTARGRRVSRAYVGGVLARTPVKRTSTLQGHVTPRAQPALTARAVDSHAPKPPRCATYAVRQTASMLFPSGSRT